MTTASLTLNKKNNIDLVLIPKKEETPFTEASVYELIELSDYAKFYVHQSNIKNAVAELDSVVKKLQPKQIGKEITWEILERRDATITFTIDKDEMSATAEIATAMGGKHLSAKAILNAAKESGVYKGFVKEKLIGLAQLAARESAGTQINETIAFGREPINGKDSRIKPLVQSAQDRILRPKDKGDGSVDMRDLGDIICVKVGDPLAQKIPFTLGKEGFTVTGTPIEPEPGEDCDLTAGEGTTISPKNENVLISTLVGLPRIIDNGMEVDQVYNVNNVDISTGHIKFEGSVIINGDVCEGMKVMATGDITIGGFVESAYVEAGGDITIGSGIIGKKQEIENYNQADVVMSAGINAKGKVYAKYCQYAQINCSDLRIENQLMHSLIEVNGSVWLGSEEKANGKLIAGFIKAGTSVSAGIVGATAGANTIVSFQARVEAFKKRIGEFDALVSAESEKTTELKNAVNKLKALPKDKANPELLNKVVATYKFHAKRMGEFLQQKEDADAELQKYMNSVYVEATEKLYHSVELKVGDFIDRSKREYGPSRMIYKERKIHIDPIVNT